MNESALAVPMELIDPVETIAQGGKILCIVIRASVQPEVTKFYTPFESALQVGKVVYPAGGVIERHSHKRQTQTVIGTPEVIRVESGRLTFDLFTDDRAYVCTRELRTDDIVVFLGGGHAFRFIEDTRLLEVKQGPYYGAQEKETF